MDYFNAYLHSLSFNLKENFTYQNHTKAKIKIRNKFCEIGVQKKKS